MRALQHWICAAIEDHDMKQLDELIAHEDAAKVRFPDGTTTLGIAIGKRNAAAVQMLLANGADVNDDATENTTSLALASELNQSAIVQLLVAAGADVHGRGRDGQSSVHHAARHGNLEMLDDLLAAGASVHSRCHRGHTALHVAAAHGEQPIVERLLECQACVRAITLDGNTALHLAAERGYVDIARLLLRRDASTSVQNKEGETPCDVATRHHLSDRFHYSSQIAAMLRDQQRAPILAQLERDPEALEIDILFRDEDVNVEYCHSPLLHHAITMRHQNLTCSMIKRGADLNAPTRSGRVPLRRVISSRMDAVGELLVRHGADIHQGTGVPNFLLHATECSCVRTLQALVDRRARDQPSSDVGLTALMFAVGRNRLDAARILVKSSVLDTSAVDIRGWTPLFVCVNDDLAELLVEHGVAWDAVDRQGLTALHRAAEQNWTSRVRWLVARGQPVDSLSTGGETALQVARRVGNLDVVETLLQLGARSDSEYVSTRLNDVTDKSMRTVFVLPGETTPLLPNNWKAVADLFVNWTGISQDGMTLLTSLSVDVHRTAAAWRTPLLPPALLHEIAQARQKIVQAHSPVLPLRLILRLLDYVGCYDDSVPADAERIPFTKNYLLEEIATRRAEIMSTARTVGALRATSRFFAKELAATNRTMWQRLVLCYFCFDTTDDSLAVEFNCNLETFFDDRRSR
ncbi:TPA: hypothetical protein N0F65_002382 [Lagenidium giganteum]|uniref:Ankyrin repeat protein n=1 Tax=Lagenidium giganteum TaxID=4803 RepID=A0AAV2YMU8_9STRA|nr:TPA: hypothetical protein N0F65_002382 [Lagenidium giganteum]